MTTIPRLDYDDPTVHRILFDDPGIHDPYAIIGCLEGHVDVDVAAREYADDHMMGEIVLDAPDLAWEFVTEIRTSDPALYDRADDRIADDVVPVEALDTLDAHMCHVAGVLVALKAEDEVYRAVDLLAEAVADGRLAETADV